MLLGLACFLVALFGYALIHRFQKVLSLASIVVLGIAVTWQLSYAPYVADYSRYLPTRTSTRQVFWYSYLAR